MKYRHLFILVLLVCLLPFSAYSRGIINTGLVQSLDNLDNQLVLQQVPLNITEAGDTLYVSWTPEVVGTLNYAIGSPGANLGAYTALNDPYESGPGYVRVLGEQLPVGQLTCVITTQDGDQSAFFQVLRASSFAPVLTSPITASGGDGINTVTPTFTWEPVAGVPYYLIFVADQPFEIIQDDDGTRVEGANVIWQAITSATSIQYGVPDPSGTIENDMMPPLVGGTDLNNRPRYNWTVLNAYGNSVVYTSSVVGTVAGFELETEAPFAPPVSISPASGAQLYDDEFLLQWSSVPQASSYLIYLSRFQTYSNGTEILFPVWRAQTTENAIVLPAASILQNDRYNWKVIAADGQGYGAMSDSTSFFYHMEAGFLSIITQDPESNRIDLAEVEFETIEGPNVMKVATDDNGSFSGEFPAGTYILHASKEGYRDAESDQTIVSDGSAATIQITMEPQPSSISGRVLNDTGSGVDNASVTSTSTSGDVFSGTTNLAGEFTILVEAGTYSIVAAADGHESSETRTVAVATGENLDLSASGGALVVTPFTYTLSGTVVNPNGQPINLAEVRLEKEDLEFRKYTGQTGQFSFTIGTGTWTIVAEKPGFYLNSGPQEVLVADEDVVHTVVLNPQAGNISGFVYVNGVPSGDESVVIRATPSAGEPVETVPAISGSFNVGVAPGSYEMKAIKAGFTSTPVSVLVGPGATVNGIQLSLVANPSTISGQVTTIDGEPLASATVTTGDESATTNASGGYSLTLQAGNHSLTASKSGYSTQTSGPWEVGYGETLSNINFQLNANVATVTGVARFGATGITGATVTATPSSGSSVSVATGSGGAYTLGLQPGTYTITVAKTGFEVLTPASYSLNLQPGATVGNRNFSLQPNTGTLSGTVNGPNGAVYGAAVSIRRTGSAATPTTTTTSVSGRFSMNVERGYTYDVSVSKQGYQSATQTSSEVPAGGEVSTNFTLSLLGSSVAGSVVSETGASVSGATVTASNGTSTFTATTTGDGRYSLSFPPGTWSFSVSAPAHLATSGDVTTTPGENRNNVNWTLTGNYARIGGFVRNAESDGIASSAVTLSRSDGTIRQATTDASGYFLFSNVVGGTYSLSASKSGFADGTLNVGLVVDGQVVSNANIILEALASSMSGLVQSGGTPVASATVRAMEAEGSVYTATTNASGAYSLPAISAGTYTLEALKSGYTGTSVTGQSVSAGGTATVNLNMVENNGEITGTISTTSGSTLAGALITADASTGHHAEATSDPSGNYTLSGLYPLANYDLVVTLVGYGSSTATNVATGEVEDFSLVPNTLQISGQTVDQQGTVVTGVPVIATNLVDGSSVTTTSDAQGSYTLNGIAQLTSYHIVSQWLQPGVEEAEASVAMQQSSVENVALTLVHKTAQVSGTTVIPGVSVAAVHADGATKSTYSDNQGAYTLTGLLDGNWTITPSKTGYSFTPSNASVSSLGVGEERDDVDFTGQAVTIAIAGTVVDDIGAALPEYMVSLLSASGTRQVASGLDGSFSFADVPGFTEYSLAVTTPGEGYQASVQTISVTNQDVLDAQIVVTITVGYVSGTVRSAADSTPLTAFFLSVDGGDATLISDPAGAYVVDHLGVGEHEFVFSRSSFESVTERLTMTTGHDTVVVNPTLAPLVNGLSVRVTHDFTGETLYVRGATVTLEQDGTTVEELTTSADGSVQFSGLSEGVIYQLTVMKPGFTSIEDRAVSLTDPDVSVLLVPKANTVFGTVVREDASLLAGGTVTLRARSGEIRTGVTDAFGAYELQTYEGALTLLAEEDDDGTSYLHSFAVTSGAYSYRDLTLHSDAAEIYGAVQTASEQPPASRALLETENTTAGTFGFQRTATDGSYEMRGLRPGDVTAALTAEGYDAPENQIFTLTAGERREVNWTVEASSTSITGQVVLAGTEQGIRGVIIDAVGPETLRMTTGGEGDFAFVDVQPGDYAITATKHGYVDASVNQTVVAGDVAGVSLELSPVANVAAGCVFDTDSETPEEGVVVRLFDGNEQEVTTATTNAEGEYSLALAVDGSYSMAPDNGYTPASYEISHTSGEGHPDLNFVKILVQGTGRIEGSLSYRSTSIVGATITLESLGGGESVDQATNASGQFVFVDVPAPDFYRFAVSSTEYGNFTTSAFELTADETLTFDLAFASGQIGVTVQDQDDLPVLNNLISVSALDGSWSTALLSNESGYAVTAATLEDGDYRVEVTTPENLLPTEPVDLTISNGDSVGVVVPLGFAYTPPADGSVNEAMTVEVTVPDTYTIVSSLLYYRNVGENFFRTTPMTIVPEPGKKSGDELDAFVTYRGEIPGQTASGSLAFYPELITDTGLVIGGEGAMKEIEVNTVGVMSVLQLLPNISEAQPGVPLLLSIRAYDEVGNNLTEDIAEGGVITWESRVEPIDTLHYLTDEKAVYLAQAEGKDTIRVQVEQPLGEGMITLSQEKILENKVRVLGDMSINAQALEIAAGDSILLTIAATDTGGAVMQVSPEWTFDGGIGNLTALEFTQQSRFVATRNRFGMARIVAKDDFTGTTSVFNDQNGGAGEGLAVYLPVTSAPSGNFSVGDGNGIRVEGVFEPDANSGQQGQLFLRRPLLPPMQRFSAGIEAASDRGVRLLLRGNLNEATLDYRLIFELPAGAEERNARIGRWDVESLSWIELSTSINEENRTITTVVNGAEYSVDGLYTILVDAKPLGIEGLKLTPNPFSPMGEYPLAFEFTLHSLFPDVWLSIDIYNMVGQHVRSLLDRQPMIKGRYARSGAENEAIIWDGLTDDHRMARNGRYMVKIVAEDPDGEVEELKTVVLVK